MSAREEFAGLLIERGALYSLGEALVEVQARTLLVCRAQFPKWKEPENERDAYHAAAKKIGDERHNAIQEPFVKRLDEANAERDAIGKRLDALAIDAEIRPGTEARKFYERSAADYSTQTNAVSYAKGTIAVRGDEMNKLGIPYAIRKRDSVNTWELWVFVESELDIAILSRKPGLTMREWLKSCWSRAINPRVLNPFLPHGLEERLGVGWQGQDIPMKRSIP